VAFTVAEMSSPRTTPTTPPIVVSVTASTRNWPITSRRLAPTARRTPISRVRWVTEMSMMFITPTPPITSETSATNTMAAVMPPVMARNCEMSWSGVTKAKSFGLSKGTRRRARRVATTFSMTSAMSSVRRGTTLRFMPSCRARKANCRSYCGNGTTTLLSGEKPNCAPFFCSTPMTR
jgi:hypothetical protein